MGRGVELHARRARSDDYSRADVERPRHIGAPDASGVVNVHESAEGRVIVGWAAAPVVSEAVQASAPAAQHPPVEVAATTSSMVAIRGGYKPGDEVGGARSVDSPGSFYIRAGSLFSRRTAFPALLHSNVYCVMAVARF